MGGMPMPEHVDMSRHSAPLHYDQHWACETPEKPHCINCVYSRLCKWCVIKARITVDTQEIPRGYTGSYWIDQPFNLKHWVEEAEEYARQHPDSF